MKKPKNQFVHNCQIRVFEYNATSPYDSSFRKFFLWLRRLLTVSKCPESMLYFRSQNAFFRETKRHLETESYSYVIHPFSIFNRVKKVLCAFIWLTLLIYEPVIEVYVFDTHQNVQEYIRPILNGFALADIITRFFVGYPVDKTRTVVLDHRKIVKKYLKTYFFFDIGGVIGFVISYFTLFTDRKYTIHLHKFRYARIDTLLSNIDFTLSSCGVHESSRIVVYLTILAIVCLHEWTCILPLIYIMSFTRKDLTISGRMITEAIASGDTDLSSQNGTVPYYMKQYLTHLSAVSSHFFACGTADFKIKHEGEFFLLSLVLLNGFLFYAYAIARILQLFGVVNISETKYEEISLQVSDYMTRMNFPKDLRRRITKYYDYKYNKTYFSEEKILDSLTEHLRMEILFYSCQNLISHVKMFRGLSKAAVGCVLSLMQQEIYITNDVILGCEEQNDDLYFILYGTCGIQLVSGKEIGHVDDGDHFGHLGNFTVSSGVLHQVVALEVSEIYKLESKAIDVCCSIHPEICDKLEAMEKKRSKFYNRLMVCAAETDEEETLDDIVAELRKGNIIQRGIKRVLFNS